MKPRNTRLLRSALKLFDLAVLALALVLAAVVNYAAIGSVSFGEFLAMPIKVQNFVLFSAFLLLWHGLFSGFGLYTLERVSRTGQQELLDVAKATLCGAAAIGVLTFFAEIELITATSLSAFWAAACGMSILGRLGLQRFLHLARNSVRDLSHLIIVGTNTRAIALAKRLQAHAELGYCLVGFVDQRWVGEERFRQTGYTVVSDLAGFQDFLRDHVVDEVIICMPVKSLYDWSSRILAQCEQQGITVRYLSDLFTPTIGHSRVDQLEEQVVLTVDTGGQTGPGMLVKRLLDLCVSAVLLVLLVPLMVAVAMAIKLTSSGPVLFVQERMGVNKRRFHLYKFRTMIADAEQRQAELEHRNEVSGPVFKIKRDPRITRVGGFLRKTSLDELPQLINVLKGDMSLVGPRPLAIRDYRGITEDWHRRRLSVRPGITCLWQVQGRNSIPFERWMELDMEYIDKWSLLLDLKILFKTIPAVLAGSGV